MAQQGGRALSGVARETRASWTCKSPSDTRESPVSKVVLGSRTARARVLAENNADRRAVAEERVKRSGGGNVHAAPYPSTTPKKGNSGRFLPYRSPTDNVHSPASKLMQRRANRGPSKKTQDVDNENSSAQLNPKLDKRLQRVKGAAQVALSPRPVNTTNFV